MHAFRLVVETMKGVPDIYGVAWSPVNDYSLLVGDDGRFVRRRFAQMHFPAGTVCRCQRRMRRSAPASAWSSSADALDIVTLICGWWADHQTEIDMMHSAG